MPKAVRSTGMPAATRRLAGRVLPGAGGQDLAEDHLVHLLRRDAGALQRGAGWRWCRGHGPDMAGEGAGKAADRRARRGSDDDIGHDWVSHPRLAAAQSGPRPRGSTSGVQAQGYGGSPRTQSSKRPPQRRLGRAAGHHADMARRRVMHQGARQDRRPAPARVAGGTIRSRAGTARKPGSRSRAGTTASPATRHSPARRGIAAVPAGQALPRHRRRQRHAVVQPVLQRDEAPRPRRGRVQPGEAAVLGGDREGVEPGEDGLDGIDRQRAERRQHRLERRQQGAHGLGLGRVGRPEVPGRRQQRQRPHPVRPALRRGQGQQPAHAVAGQHHRSRHARARARSSRPAT